MATYTYSREFGDTIHSSPDTYNIGHDGEHISIANRVITAIPGLGFTVSLSSTEIIISTDRDLTSQEQSDLVNQISTHKAVVDWPVIEQSNELPSGEIYIEDLSETSTTATSPQQKLHMVLQVSNDGEYLISWNYSIRGSKTRNYTTRVQLDDSIDLDSEKKYKIVNKTNSRVFSGFKKVALTVGEHTIDIDFWRSGGNMTAYIKEASLLARRL